MNDNSKITLTFLGDLICNNDLIRISRVANGIYDFKSSFDNVKPYLQKTDYVIGNLEVPISSKRDVDFIPNPSGFRAPLEYLEGIIDAGIDLFLTANNHTYDFNGEEGLLTTLNMLNLYGVDHIGTYATQEEADKVFIKEIHGIKIAFLNYTYGINFYGDGTLPSKNNFYQINFLTPPEYQAYDGLWNHLPSLLKIHLPIGYHRYLFHSEKTYDYSELTKNIKKKIAEAKGQGAEFIVLLPHFGMECVTRPPRFVRNWCETMFKAGADVIIGSHPHTLQQMEYRNIEDCFGQKKNRFLIYSLGNFLSQNVSYCPSKLSGMSIKLNVNIEKDSKTGNVDISSVNCIPILNHTESKDKPVKIYVLSDEIKKARDTGNSEKEMTLSKTRDKIYSIITDNSSIDPDIGVFYSEDLQHKEKWVSLLDLKHIFKNVFMTLCLSFLPQKIKNVISQKRSGFTLRNNDENI